MVPDGRAIDEIGIGKKPIQCEKRLRRSMQIEVIVDDPNSLMSLE